MAILFAHCILLSTRIRTPAQFFEAVPQGLPWLLYNGEWFKWKHENRHSERRSVNEAAIFVGEHLHIQNEHRHHDPCQLRLDISALVSCTNYRNRAILGIYKNRMYSVGRSSLFEYICRTYSVTCFSWLNKILIISLRNCGLSGIGKTLFLAISVRWCSRCRGNSGNSHSTAPAESSTSLCWVSEEQESILVPSMAIRQINIIEISALLNQVSR